VSNDNHDEKGRFASGSQSGAATGDHASVSPDTATRNVPGHGNVPRSKVVAKHAGAASVGTSSGGGGGGGGGSGGRGIGGSAKPKFIATAGGLKPKQMSTGLSGAAREKRALGIATDARHYPDNKDVQRSLTKAVRGIGSR
jgi:hypothetical protein